MTIAIKEYPSETYELIDGEFEPQHEDAELDRACCSGRDSEGNPSCGCGGSDGVYCPAVDCPGIRDYQIDALMDRLRPEPDHDDRGDDE